MPSQKANDRRGPARAGFTLVELMVVIVIILLLAGLLLPALQSARVRAQKTASHTQLAGIAAACESYKMALKAYPGYFPNSGTNGIDSLSTVLTMNQSMLISLMGHVDDVESGDQSATVGGKTINITKIGTGPVDAVYNKSYGPFYSAKGSELVVIKNTAGGDSDIPNLVDVSSGMPLLMWRVSPSGTTPVATQYSGGGQIAMSAVNRYINSSMLKQANDSTQYDEMGLSLLSSTVASSNNLTNLAWAVIDRTASTIPTGNTTAVNDTNDVIDGGFVLISPGPDGIYFSKEQVTKTSNQTTIESTDDLSVFDDQVVVGGSR